MNIHTALAVASPSEFTGFEHTRIVDLLTVLALISIGMWVIVAVSMVIRQVAIMMIKLIKYSRAHRFSVLRYIGRNNGS